MVPSTTQTTLSGYLLLACAKILNGSSDIVKGRTRLLQSFMEKNPNIKKGHLEKKIKEITSLVYVVNVEAFEDQEEWLTAIKKLFNDRNDKDKVPYGVTTGGIDIGSFLEDKQSGYSKEDGSVNAADKSVASKEDSIKKYFKSKSNSIMVVDDDQEQNKAVNIFSSSTKVHNHIEPEARSKLIPTPKEINNGLSEGQVPYSKPSSANFFDPKKPKPAHVSPQLPKKIQQERQREVKEKEQKENERLRLLSIGKLLIREEVIQRPIAQPLVPINNHNPHSQNISATQGNHLPSSNIQMWSSQQPTYFPRPQQSFEPSKISNSNINKIKKIDPYSKATSSQNEKPIARMISEVQFLEDGLPIQKVNIDDFNLDKDTAQSPAQSRTFSNLINEDFQLSPQLPSPRMVTLTQQDHEKIDISSHTKDRQIVRVCVKSSTTGAPAPSKRAFKNSLGTQKNLLFIGIGGTGEQKRTDKSDDKSSGMRSGNKSFEKKGAEETYRNSKKMDAEKSSVQLRRKTLDKKGSGRSRSNKSNVELEKELVDEQLSDRGSKSNRSGHSSKNKNKKGNPATSNFFKPIQKDSRVHASLPIGSKSTTLPVPATSSSSVVLITTRRVVSDKFGVNVDSDSKHSSKMEPSEKIKDSRKKAGSEISLSQKGTHSIKADSMSSIGDKSNITDRGKKKKEVTPNQISNYLKSAR